MTHDRYTTPGTRLTWSDVSEWVDAAHRIGSRQLSAARNRAYAAHAAALPRELIDRATHVPSLETALHLLKYGHPSLGRPQRGHRANHPTTSVIMDLMNRLAVLKRQDQMGAGDNWTAMFGGSDAHSG
ncbi:MULTISPECIES: hypothetical protein [unclassified Mameliella]|uniref:hypothetical protein n=1 Tax=unclassified Mameliella TaxID=2630630 RepID=UPI00273EC18C|nr:MULTISPECIES: hypothetical protein [unclassified Mameliella]